MNIMVEEDRIEDIGAFVWTGDMNVGRSRVTKPQATNHLIPDLVDERYM
jgi:hypothetical protein